MRLPIRPWCVPNTPQWVLRGVDTARDGANLVTALEQALHHSATLFARASRDDDGKLLTHDPLPFTCDM
jgi:hypothetical protein